MLVWRLWSRRVLLPAAATGLAIVATSLLWPHIKPSATPLFFLAVLVSSVYGGVLAGVLSTALSSISTAYFFMEPELSLRVESADVFRLIVFAAVASLANSVAAERNRAQTEQSRLVDELSEANARIRTLSDALPVCPDCKRVRVGKGWKPVEQYLSETPELQISHALCPECSSRHFPEFHPAAS